MKQTFSNGDIVRVTSSFLNEPKNVLAYVYDEYSISGNDHGVSIITENGCDLGGFSEDEQEQYLEFVRKSGHTYDFRNVIQLDWDFSRIIKPLIENFYLR